MSKETEKEKSQQNDLDLPTDFLLPDLLLGKVTMQSIMLLLLMELGNPRQYQWNTNKEENLSEEILYPVVTRKTARKSGVQGALIRW